MKDNTISVVIQKPVTEVFDFALNPENALKWVPGFVKEERSTNPTREGTIYKNTRDGKNWNTYIISEFEKDKLFTFSSQDTPYHCRYTFTSIDRDTTQLTYYEWMDSGELGEPFSQSALDQLKKILEM